MRLFTALTVAAGIGFALSAIPASATNLIDNPGFETGSLPAWAQGNNFGGTDWSVTSSTSHSGTFSATQAGNTEIIQSFAPTAVSGITSITFWEKQDVGEISAVDLLYSDSTFGEFVINVGTNWTLEDVTSDLEAGKTLTGIGVYGVSNGISFLDDVNIEAGSRSAVPEPSPVAAFAVGIFGLGALSLFARRRRSAN